MSNVETEASARPGLPKKRGSGRTYIRNILALLIVAGFFFYLWEHWDQLRRSLDASPWHIVSLCTLILLYWIVSGLQAAVIYQSLGIPIGVREGTLLTTAGVFGNYLPMRAGTLVRALYLKEVHGLRLARFGGITGLRAILTMVAAGILGLVGLALSALEVGKEPPLALISAFASLAILPVVFMLLPIPQWSWLPARLERLATDMTDAYDELRRQPGIAVRVVALLILQYLILWLRFVVSADAVGAVMPVSFLLLMAPLAALMSFAALTPGALGIREALMGYVALTLGFPFSKGVFIATIDRAVLLAMVAMFGSFAFLVLWRRVGRQHE